VPTQKEIQEQKEKAEARIREEIEKFPEDEIVNEEGEFDLDYIKLCYNANELGDAELYSRMSQGKVAFNPLAGRDGRWMKFVGPHWEPDWMGRSYKLIEETVVPQYLRLLDKVSVQIKETDDSDREKQLKKYRTAIKDRIKRLRSSRGRAGVMKYMQRNDETRMSFFEKDCDLHPYLLPCRNGIVDLRNGEFSDEPRPELFLTKCAATEWTGLDAPAPNWERFLMTILDEDEDVFEFKHRLLGYAVSGLKSERFYCVLFGARGQNGKGTELEVLSDILGDLAAPVPSEMLLSSRVSKNAGAPSPEIMNCRARRMIWASETEEGAHFATSKVKWISGGDTMTGRNLNDRDFTVFNPTHTFFLMTNYKPGAPSHDSAFWERTIIFDYPFSFVHRNEKAGEKYADHERPAIRNLDQILLQEKEGILAWLVRGFLKYQKEGLNPPKKVLRWRTEYREEEDLIKDFVEECCEIREGERESVKVLYARFREWFEEIASVRPMSRKKFGSRMNLMFERIKSNGYVYYLGLQIDVLAGSRSQDEDD